MRPSAGNPWLLQGFGSGSARYPGEREVRQTLRVPRRAPLRGDVAEGGND